MDFKELVSDFAARHGIEGLAAEDGVAALEVDGIAVALAEIGGDLVATAVIGDPPAEGRADFADLLLSYNLESEAFFAKSGESGRYMLCRRVALAVLDGKAFDSMLEYLLNTAENWRHLLADYRPAAEAAARAAAEDDTDLASGGGFLQV